MAHANASTPQVSAAKLSVIVPTYNEYRNLEELVRRLDLALAGILWEVIIVDDDSPDGTAQLAKSMSAQDGRIRCIHRIGRRGLAGACIEGILSSSAPVIVVMDGDLQHDETILPKMLSLIEGGADLIVASRYIEGGSSSLGLSKTRGWGSRVATNMAREALNISISDPMSGFFMARREKFEAAVPKLSHEGFKILLDFIASSPSPLKIAEVPFQFRERTEGDSKLGTLVVFDYIGLLLSKISGGLLRTRFLMFATIGATGILVHICVLRAALNVFNLPFATAQFTGMMIAMTSNFFLNNQLTFSDKKLRGWHVIPGLLSFYLACSVGAVANVGVASWINESWHSRALLAGLAGAVLGAVYNYAASSALTWKTR